MSKAEKKLKIAMLGHKRIPSREGGIEIVVEELASRMVRRGHEVVCLNRAGHHVSGKEFDRDAGDEYRGIRLRTVPTIDRRGLAAMTSSLSAALIAAFGRFDVVHFHAEGPAAMCLIPHLAGKRVVVTIHGLDWARAQWGGFASRYIKWGERQAVKYADEIIVLSRGVQNYFLENYGRKTVYIPNGVTRPEPVPAERITDRWGLEKDGYILFLGRIVPEKGLRILLEAWKGVHTDKKLVIAGGSSDTQDFMDELISIADERVVFTGFQQGRILEELYSNCYLYCLPSDLEGMPLSLLEAMSYGNCCVVSDIPECTEVVGDKAAVFAHSSAEELKRVLQRLLDSPETVRRYRAGAAEYICARFDWENVVDRTLELYHG